MPIITIYFLGFPLPEYDNVALIVNNRVMDATTKEEIETKNDFVQLLTHPSYILQTTKLPPKRLTKLERFLGFFDQSRKTDDDYVLDIEGQELTDLEDIASYLNKGTLDEELLNALAYEEDYEESVKNLEEELIEERRQREKERRQKEKERRQKEKERRQKEEERRQKKEAQQKITDLAKMLKSMQVPDQEIADKTGLSLNEIKNL